MGAFFLYPQTAKISLEKVKDLFVQKGFLNYSEFKIGEYNLLLYKKILLSEPNYISNNGDFICCVGTFIYKGLLDRDGLESFSKDFKEGNVCNNLISGTFCLLIYQEGRFFLLNDDENIYPVYLHRDSNCISTSFLALCQISDSLTIHKSSVLENIVTGCSYGFDTYFVEIKRFRWGRKTILPGNIIYKEITKDIDQKNLLKETIIDILKSNLSDTFQSIAPAANKFGCEIGISGGFDSRLALALCLKYFHFKKISIGCNYKNPPDNDLLSAREIVSSLGKSLIEIEVKKTDEMPKEYFENTLRDSFLFYDGQFRVNHGWTREYRTLNYRKKMLNGCLLGISGHGGELFRNDFNLDNRNFSYRNWLKNNVLNQSGLMKCIKDTDSLIKYIQLKFHPVIDINVTKLNRRAIHSYYNEIWLPAGPGIRISIENQLSYYISPFTDYKISKSAYQLSSFLNDSSFEKYLINNYYGQFSSIPFDSKNRSLVTPLVYTTLMYRYGINLHSMSRKYLRFRNGRSHAFKTIYNSQLETIINLFSNCYLKSIFSENDFLKYIVNESEFDRLIAFAYVADFFKDKLKS